MSLLCLIFTTHADFEVTASASKTKDVTVTGYTEKKAPGANGGVTMKFKKGDTILLKGMDLGFSKSVLIDVIKVDGIDSSGMFGWWSKPKVTSHKLVKGGVDGKVKGKDNLKDHLNGDNHGAFVDTGVVKEEPGKLRNIWIEKLGDTSKYLWKDHGCSEHSAFHSSGFPHKPGAGGVGKIDDALKVYFKMEAKAHGEYQDILEYYDDYDDEEEIQSQRNGFHVPRYINSGNNSGMDNTNPNMLLIMITVLLFGVIGCICCLASGVIGGFIGYFASNSMSNKSKMQPIDHSI